MVLIAQVPVGSDEGFVLQPGFGNAPLSELFLRKGSDHFAAIPEIFPKLPMIITFRKPAGNANDRDLQAAITSVRFHAR